MEQNQLYLIKQLEKKINDLKKVISDPDGYNTGLASEERVENLEKSFSRIDDLEKRIEGQSYLVKQLIGRIERVEELEKKIASIEADLKEVRYILGK